MQVQGNQRKQFTSQAGRAFLALMLIAAIPALAVGIGAVPGCSEVELPGADAAIPISIVIVPGNVKLAISGDVVQTKEYRAYAFYKVSSDFGAGADSSAGGDSGSPPGGKDITKTVAWSVSDSSMGRFQGSTFRTETSDNGKIAPVRHGGVTTVTAEIAGIKGSSTLTLSFTKSFFAGKAASGAANKFSGTKKANAVTVFYPPTGVLVPPNLGQMAVHFNKGGSANDLFRVRLVGANSTVNIYTTEVTHNLNLAQWAAVGLSNPGSDVTLTVESVSSKAPAVRLVSKAVVIKIADAEIRGGLYYWVVSKAKPGQAQDDEGIYRYDFNTPSLTSEAYYTRKEAGDCVGCHSLSRGGEKIAFTKSGGNGNTAIFDVKNRTAVVDSKYRGDIQTFSPDGAEVIVVYKGALERRDATNGKLLETLPTGASVKATHPDWSPDGKSVVYVSVPSASYNLSDKGFKILDDVHFRNGGITLITRDSSGKWGTPKVLLKGGSNVNWYYPTFSPRGDWIIFNRSMGDSYSDQNAQMYIIKPSGKGFRGLTPLNLSNMSNSWPRWGSFVQKYNGRTLYWLTFSSVRNYGLLLRNSSTAKFDDKVPQIWMTSFDVAKAEAGANPVTPPFWLPFQDLKHHNHIAQWTEKVISIH